MSVAPTLVFVSIITDGCFIDACIVENRSQQQFRWRGESEQGYLLLVLATNPGPAVLQFAADSSHHPLKYAHIRC